MNFMVFYFFRCFRLMDDNRDRKLNAEELKLGLDEFGASMDATQVGELFKEIDKDGSGNISLEEFLRAVRVSCFCSILVPNQIFTVLCLLFG